LDYVTYEEMKKVKKALMELGFSQKDRYFMHEGCLWLIEFVSPPVAIGNEPIRKFNSIITSLGTIKLLYPVDSVKDRLASFYHWNDKQSIEQAISICLEQEIDLDEVEQWSIQENHQEKFNIFKKLLVNKKRNLKT
jgi:hypothetical protein